MHETLTRIAAKSCHRSSALKLSLAVAGAIAGWNSSADAQLPPSRPYIFADASSDDFFTFGPPSLNNAGTAAFVTGFHPSDARLRVAGADGIATTVLDTTGDYDVFSTSPDINNAGHIAVEAGIAGTSDYAMIRTSLGGPTIHIAETSINGSPGTFDFFRGAPTINTHGQVAFVGLRGDSVEGVFVGNGSGAPVALASDLDGLFDFSEEAAINDSGTVAFYAVNDDDVAAVYTAGPGGIQPIMIGDTAFSFSTPDINNAGTLTFVSRDFSSDRVLAAAADGSSRVIASSGEGDADYWNFETTLINEQGDVMFFAELNNFENGIFHGPNSARDRVIMTGDELFDSILEELYFFDPPMFKGLNDDNQVAFSYRLEDGRHGIAIGTPATLGDADLNNIVNFDDYSAIDNGFNNGLTGWFNGDFDANGAIDFDDYALIDASFNNQGTGIVAVPEPATTLFIALASALRRRRPSPSRRRLSCVPLTQ